MRASFFRRIPHAERLVLEAPPGASLEALALAGPDLARRLAGSTLRLGDRVAEAGVELVVRAAEPRLPAKVHERAAIEIQGAKPDSHDGFDLVVLLDASKSMREGDFEPTRFIAGLGAVRDLLVHAGDVIRRVEVTPFQNASEPLAPLGALEALRLGDVARVEPRGPGNVESALENALARLEAAPPPKRRRVLLVVTDGDAYEFALDGFGHRAAAVGVRVGGLVLGGDDAPGLAKACADSGGVYLEAWEEKDVNLRPVLASLAQELEVPVEWSEPASAKAGDDAREASFEVVVRASAEEPSSALASRARRIGSREDSS